MRAAATRKPRRNAQLRTAADKNCREIAHCAASMPFGRFLALWHTLEFSRFRPNCAPEVPEISQLRMSTVMRNWEKCREFAQLRITRRETRGLRLEGSIHRFVTHLSKSKTYRDRRSTARSTSTPGFPLSAFRFRPSILPERFHSRRDRSAPIWKRRAKLLLVVPTWDGHQSPLDLQLTNGNQTANRCIKASNSWNWIDVCRTT